MAETLSQKLAAEAALRATQFELLHSCLLDMQEKIDALEHIVREVQTQRVSLASAWATAEALEQQINAALARPSKPVRFVHPYLGGQSIGPDQTEIGHGDLVPDVFVVTRDRCEQVGKRMAKQAILDWLEQYPCKPEAA